MYPLIFRIGDFDVTSFGVMVAVAFAVGLSLLRRELKRGGLPLETSDAAIWGIFGGLLGAKLVWAVEFWRDDSFATLFFSRGGLSWYGGLVGGLIAGIAALRFKRAPVLATLAAATPAFAFGHLLGRIGCFLVGDDYGRPSDLPWAVAFPQGLPPTTEPVHPTQLYEAFALGIVGWLLLRWRRAEVSDHVVLGRYLVLAGAIRFAIEFVRVNERIAGPLTLAQLFATAVIVAGVILLGTRVATAPTSPAAVRTPRAHTR